MKNLRIDITCLGHQMLFASMRPYYDYQDGKKLDTPAGIKYDVILPECGLERLSVKVPGDPKIPDDTATMTPVRFTGLIVRPYVADHNINLTATAEDIELVNVKA